jgi:hypothetical protein
MLGVRARGEKLSERVRRVLNEAAGFQPVVK